jgi:hypothetical protein
MTQELQTKLEAVKTALITIEELGITPMDLLAYALVLDVQDIDAAESLVELVRGAFDMECEDPCLGEDLYTLALMFAEALSE